MPVAVEPPATGLASTDIVAGRASRRDGLVIVSIYRNWLSLIAAARSGAHAEPPVSFAPL